MMIRARVSLKAIRNIANGLSNLANKCTLMGMAGDNGDLHDTVGSLDDFVGLIAEDERHHAMVAIAAARLAERGEWACDGHVSMGSWFARPVSDEPPRREPVAA